MLVVICVEPIEEEPYLAEWPTDALYGGAPRLVPDPVEAGVLG